MVARNRLISLLYRLLAFGVSVASLVICVNSSGPTIFFFFTILSGLFVCVCLGAKVIANLIDLIRHGINGIPAGIYMPITLAGVLYITVTAVVGNILFPMVDASGLNLTLLFSHTLVPVVYVLDWVIFGEKGTVKWINTLYWLIFPLLYCAFIYLRPFIMPGVPLSGTSMYPYPFLDPDVMGGVWMVVLHIIMFVVVFKLLGSSIVFLNNLMSGKYKKRIKNK